MKSDFLNIISRITDDKLRDASKKILENLPDYFWHLGASSTGKYHPDFANGEGGLERHSLMVYKIAEDLLHSEVFCRDNADNLDVIIVATLFHDCLKYGKEVGMYTVFDHPIISADFVKPYLVEAGVDSYKVQMIDDAIRCHMGKWTTSSKSEVKLTRPETDLEKLVHTADYIASRKYVTMEGVIL